MLLQRGIPDAFSVQGRQWQQEYEAWKKRPLRGHCVYPYADGFYLKAGAEEDKAAVGRPTTNG